MVMLWCIYSTLARTVCVGLKSGAQMLRLPLSLMLDLTRPDIKRHKCHITLPFMRWNGPLEKCFALSGVTGIKLKLPLLWSIVFGKTVLLRRGGMEPSKHEYLRK